MQELSYSDSSCTRSETVLANAGDDEVDVVGVEGVMLTQMGTDLVDELPDMVVHGAAFAAHHVKVVVGMGDLPTSRVVDAEMGLADQIEILEQGKRSVDRGDADGGIGLVDTLCDVFGGEVTVGGSQHGPHQPPGAGQTVSVVTKDTSQLGKGFHTRMV